jgi:hypothetical protein
MKALLTQKPIAISVIVATILILAAATTQTMPNLSFAQLNNATTTQPAGQNSSDTTARQLNNASIVIDQGNVTSLTLNTTIIPLQKTTIEVRTITKSIDNKLISELQNTTVLAGTTQSSSISLSKMANQTITSAAGQATSVIVTRSVTPYNITTFQLTTTGQNQNITQYVPPSADLLKLFTTNSSQQQVQSNQTTSQSNQTTSQS